MIQATAKANSLPPELRKHWEDSMADKFPMTVEEAGAYIHSRWPQVIFCFGHDCIKLERQMTSQIVPANAPYTEGIGTAGPSYQSYSWPQTVIDRLTITDFRKTAIDTKLTKFVK